MRHRPPLPRPHLQRDPIERHAPHDDQRDDQHGGDQKYAAADDRLREPVVDDGEDETGPAEGLKDPHALFAPIGDLPDVQGAASQLVPDGGPAGTASAVEFVLEGLHLNRKLNKDRTAGKSRYRR